MDTDKFFLILSLIHIPIISLFSIGYGTFWQVSIAASFIFVLHLVSYLTSKNSLFLKFFVALALLSYSALLIHAQLGRIEMHFHVFGALAFLLLYQEWKIIPVGAVYIALYHLVGNYLQEYNCTIGEIPIYVFNYGTGLDIVLVHAFFVIFESMILVYISIFLKNMYNQNQAQIKVLEDYRANIQKLIQNLHDTSSKLKQKIDNFSSEIENSKKIIYNSLEKVGTITQITSSFQKATEDILKTSEHQIKTFAHLKLQNSESFESLENYIQDQSKINQSIRNSIESLEKGFENFVTLKQITERVSKQSNEMTQISTLISDIADRVNLLSLNASIEAARAG
ncbi:MAG: methyl-accepting chemotaxis protein, partial [Leptospiraceae bacterium]|nr:methyl-accepting chemotaxis protein [Leptospiraceae bacterium]